MEQGRISLSKQCSLCSFVAAPSLMSTTNLQLPSKQRLREIGKEREHPHRGYITTPKGAEKHTLTMNIQMHTVVAKSFENYINISFQNFAAKLLLDLCFSCFCDVLKYSYKHFIRFKGFYRQLHDIYAKSQYLQCWPFFFRTSAIRLGMLSINFWAKS